MREEQLELLITIDDPVGLPEDDIFNHLHANNLEYWLSQFPGWRALDQRTDIVNDNGASGLTFGQGDWTCTLSTLNGATNGSMKGSNLDVCTITQWKDGEIVEQKLFCDLAGVQKRIGAILNIMDHRPSFRLQAE